MNNYRTLFKIQQDLKEGFITCKQVAEFYLNRIKEQSHLNAFLEVYETEVLERAAHIDEKIRTGKPGKLHGLVMGMKDVICHKGHYITAGSKILNGFASLYNSTVTQKLLDEDAIIIGRLNCDEFAMGSSSENSAFGAVLNPVDTTKVPGGSSGGSAAAVAANLCHAALGSDTGGSVRQPASFCGVVGVKPTYGRVSRHGLIAYASSFDQIGPLTKSVEDAALILEVIAGTDEFDGTVSSKEVPNYSTMLEKTGKYRIAYFNDIISHKGLDPEIKEFTENMLSGLEKSGHKVKGLDFPYLDFIVPAYYVMTTAEASSNLARYDGVHYGYRHENSESLDAVYIKSRTAGFGKEVKKRIMLGTFVLSSGYYDAYYTKAQKVRRIIFEKTKEILKDFDFILMPTTPKTAFGIGEKTKDPISMYLEDIFTVHANLSGIPAISLPLGTHSNGMPFGIQLMAGKFEEAKLLAFSKELTTV